MEEKDKLEILNTINGQILKASELIQSWIVEQLAPEIENWINQHYSLKIINDNVSLKEFIQKKLAEK